MGLCLNYCKVVFSLLFLLIDLLFGSGDGCLSEDICEPVWLFLHDVEATVAAQVDH